MESIRKWFYRPKKDDKSLLAQFFYADEALNIIANDLDSFDGRKDPERCTSLVNQLRQSQDKVLTITNAIMDDLIGDERANRDFRVKFPEDVLQENLAGQLWFGAECLAAGSSIMNREAESIAMRPLARTVTKSLEHVRNLLRDACLRNNTPNGPLKLDNNELVNEMLVESLKIFDKFFAEFELEYVSAMVPVKSTQEYELQEQIGVLFSETLQRALRMKLLTQEMVDSCDPALMFTIPRLAIVSGLLFFAAGPLYVDKPMEEMSEMFRPFRTLLHKIRELLWTLNKRELYMLEKLLCDNEDISDVKSVSDVTVASYLDAFIDQFYSDYSFCKDFTSASSFCAQNGCRETNREITGSRAGTEQKSINIPSTSTGYLISNSVAHDAILGTINDVSVLNRNNIESPPDQDSLEVISVAAATLSSILNNGHGAKTSEKDLESPNDSGVCTETTSLDRSPSLDLNETKQCACSDGTSSRTVNCNCNDNRRKLNAQSLPANEKIHVIKTKSFVPGAGKTSGKRTLTSRKRTTMRRNDDVIDEDSSSVGSSDTSSFNSNCADDEEIALAMQAAEIATRNEIRSKYRSSEDLLHRLFVCIAGVADQLQTNFASDLRNILKAVFLINACDSSDVALTTSETSSCLETSIEYHPTASEVVIENNEFSVDPNILAQEALFDTNVYFHLEESRDENNEYTNHPRQQQQADEDNVNILSDDLYRYASIRDNFGASPVSQGDIMRSSMDLESPPKWIPDVEAPKCMSCKANFTVVKRRHHCRNCGKIFCARCSSNSVPLPKFGHVKPVRVCNKCFLYHLTPFTSLCD